MSQKPQQPSLTSTMLGAPLLGFAALFIWLLLIGAVYIWVFMWPHDPQDWPFPEQSNETAFWIRAVLTTICYFPLAILAWALVASIGRLRRERRDAQRGFEVVSRDASAG